MLQAGLNTARDAAAGLCVHDMIASVFVDVTTFHGRDV